VDEFKKLRDEFSNIYKNVQLKESSKQETSVITLIAKHHKVVDSISIIKAQNNLTLKIGENEVENINAVLPLFDKDDNALAPLIRSKLYHLLMTFNVMQTIDTLYEDAYLALLSLIFLLKEPKSEYKYDLLENIYHTVKIVYNDNSSFIKYREALIENPFKAIPEDQEQRKYGSIDLFRAILHLYMMWHDNIGNSNKE